jgi:2-beta-glucuronyltransferase
MKRALILTGHFPQQARRAGIPWLADRMQADSWHVTFASIGYSRLSRLTGDRRLQGVTPPPLGTTKIGPTLTTIYDLPLLHPVSLRSPSLDRLITPLFTPFIRFWSYRLAAPAAQSDLIVVESGPPLLLARALRAAAPATPIVYRASDDIRLLNLHPMIVAEETAAAPFFDRISVASPLLARRWTDHPGLAIDPVGIPKSQLAADQPDPFPMPRASTEAVCAGTTLFDMDQALRLARLMPDWRITVIGRLRSRPDTVPPNLRLTGELPFDTTTAHIRHANVGLALYADRPGVEYQIAQSNRLLLYRHFRLPILAPHRLCDPNTPSIIGFDPRDDDDIRKAAARALALPPPPPDPDIPDWDLLYTRIAATRRLRTA